MKQNLHWEKNCNDQRPFVTLCAVLNMTDEGLSAGRCWSPVRKGRCRVHGDVAEIQRHYEATGYVTRSDGKPLEESCSGEPTGTADDNLSDGFVAAAHKHLESTKDEINGEATDNDNHTSG